MKKIMILIVIIGIFSGCQKTPTSTVLNDYNESYTSENVLEYIR